MITFADFQKIHNTNIPGRARKAQSDNIMLNTWWQDIQAQTAYIYDYYHDQKSEESLKLTDLHPAIDPQKVPLPIKFIRHASQTYDKDQVTFWLQMQPGQECNLDYYDEVLGKRYGSTFPIGLYVDILQEDNTYDKWLIVDKANYNGNQFPTFEILRCDYVAQWIFNGHKYQCPVVLRSQNSYNSGLWLDYKIQSVEDQQKFAAPMTKDTETLFYNIRMLIDTKVDMPRAWLISKVNRISPNGVCRITLAQDIFDQHNDYIEKDEDGNIIGMWANYYKSNIQPIPIEEDNPTPSVTAKISCSGKPQFKIGGSSKTFTISYYDGNQEVQDHQIGTWSFSIDGESVPNELLTIVNTDEANKIKVKFLGDDAYIGKILTITNTHEDATASMQVEIIAL